LAGQARDGLIQRSEIGRFIAENLRRDPDSKVLGTGVVERLARDLAGVLGAGAAALRSLLESDRHSTEMVRTLEEKLTKLLGEDNLVGSAGEFGLLFAFLLGSPKTQKIDGEPALSLDDIRSMFVLKTLPEGWATWKKRRADWTVQTALLAAGAEKEYRRLG
jgi:hypothetical protein